MWSSTIFYLLLLCTTQLDADKRVNKYVTTLIDAKWKETPLMLEAAEYLNDENPNYFWKFIDTFAKNDFRNVTEKENYNSIVEFAEKYLSSSEIALLKLGLSLRIYSARVEMFTQMAENKNISKFGCYNVVDIGGKFTCSAEELDELVNRETWLNPDTYSVDHRYRTSQQSDKVVILYSQVGAPNFSVFHEKLKDLAESKGFTYILRHYLKDRAEQNVRLSGYGVELQMKSTEYKATDDSDIKDNADKDSETSSDSMEEIDGINFMTLKNLYPDKQEELDKLQTHLLETSHEIGALKVWQFQELSHQAAERIMNSPTSEAINVLTDISQNFPMQAKSLIRTKVNGEMKKEMKLNQAIFSSNLNIQPTDTALFVNGLFFDLEAVDVLSLLESLRSELRVMESLRKIGFSNTKMSKLLSLDLSMNMDKQDFAMDIRDSAIIWINDIEQDSTYSRWSASLTELLRPTFPGMLRNIRRNLYNLVLIIDPLSAESTPLIALAQSLHLHAAPLRVGFVFVTNYDATVTGLMDASVAVNNAYHYFAEMKGSEQALQFLVDLGNYIGPDGADLDDVKKAIRAQDSSADINYILGEESEYDIGRHLAGDFVKRSGFKKFPQALMNGVPLSSDQLNADSFEEAVLSTIISQTPALQKAVYRGEITEGDDVVDYMMNQPNVMPRLNERILKAEKHTWLNLIGTVPKDEDYSKWSPEDFSTWLMNKSHYLYVPRRTNIHHLYTFWVVTDLNSSAGRLLLREALDYIESNADVRITVIVNPMTDANNLDDTVDINKIALAALNSLSTEKARHFIRKVIEEDAAKVITAGNFNIEEEAVTEQLRKQIDEFPMYQRYVKTVLNIEKGARGIVCNGRLIGPFDDNEEFSNEDFSLLERFSQTSYGDKLFKKLIKEQLLEDDEYEKNEITDDMIMKITSLLVSHPQTRSRFDVPFHGDDHSSIKIQAANPEQAAFSLVAIVDPVSRGAQKLGPILKTLQQSLNCNVKVFLNCLDKNSDMPLKSFYRFVFEPHLQFSADGHINGAMAKFTKLPTSSLLTQYIHAPENWLVEVVRSVYDLDNIKLDNVAMGVHSEFELEHLLLEGHCFEAVMGNPPRGLQFTLGTERQPLMVDTIVMANLGYFQLKANPGEWILRLRQGRSSEIYDFATVGGQDVIQKDNNVRVVISSLRSHVLKVKVSKKPDKVGMDLLSEDDKNSGLWNSISRTFTTTDDSEDQDEKLNIFSLASGHLYERFLKIMMLSVIKHTKTPVKFWFLKNYLSPTLKDFLPYMANEYGFEYELVQYKWPRWLHQQTEKQRTIWGYKILFLDVLFPLNVKKIIFVDADQVVRADLKELATMDLGGAPYAYTPFCDSRREMDGFRFWKQGYWRNHLQGRSYHISALYVVDLKRFRRIAAGDRLRGQYQALSQDPNSLANLDQDLPNNMIHQVAIKTLPQEWLWCETWCDDASKRYAKTIDLCNNPMTKEAKLQAAVRILPEWVGYDEEIKALQQKVENQNRQTEKEEEHEIFAEEATTDSRKHQEL
ncbi:UDP-glucose-glycoprotein glucosyltransferase [Nomia melanderi]|uniref:UDP-glucose-glycoprotein glucosyltransferase n=1 Tax=Nomia melanderi TaxID=2448451 RepID=UPI001304570E|nr:UDP-glucose:glycoprotein glucosyltransferase [Nomia melanderi]XP_031847874.1 UDP-glucose:glycoprotein glucosyltransferase [Nomia melanderi]XP_031847875.1 UDP-glucose:glycoprotein glucosyltransferase [Nomia melanderi]